MSAPPEGPAGFDDLRAYLALGVGLAALFALISAAIAAWRGRGGESARGPRWGVTLGLGLGVLLAHEAVREAFTGDRPASIWSAFRLWGDGKGDFPLAASEAIHSLPWVVLAALFVGLFDGDRPCPRWARWENRALLIALLLWLILGPLIGGSWGPRDGAAWMIGLGAGLFAWWTWIDARAERLGASMPLTLLIPAAALPAMLFFAHAAMRAALAGGFAAVLGCIWLVSLPARRLSLARGGVPIFAVVFSGLILDGVFYNDLARPAALLLGLAPLASAVDRIGPVGRLSPRKLAAVRIAAVAAVTASAVAWAWWAIRDLPVG